MDGLRNEEVQAIADTLDLTNRWVVRTSVVLTRVLELKNTLDDLSVKSHLALMASHLTRQTKLRGEFERTQQIFEETLKLLAEWTDEDNVYMASQRITDVRARLGLAWEAHEAWRRMLAQAETAAFARLPVVELEQQAEQLKTEFIIQTELAARALPRWALEN